MLATSSCGSEAGDAERFCGEVAAHVDELTNPSLAFADDIEPLLELYRDIGAFAPLAIEEE